MAAQGEAFTLIDRLVDSGDDNGPPHLSDKYEDLSSAKLANPFVQILASLRDNFPEYVVTYVGDPGLNLPLFAAAGNATATLDTETDSVIRARMWYQPSQRGSIGQLADAVIFGKYHYRWGREDFILYTVRYGISFAQFVLKERASGEGQQSHSTATDALLTEIGKFFHVERPGIWVFDQYWYFDSALYEEVQKASWDKVILDAKMKKDLTKVSGRFFDSKSVYEDLGVPWKRGLIFYGPAGNGKTVSIKALMHTLADRKAPIPTLYVKAAPQTYHIRAVFARARELSPCLLVLEDIDTIVTAQTRSYFFNEVDGLASNDGILMVASTNHIDELDPGLSKRPSRFDRKYLFPLPNKSERIQYVQYWRKKLAKRSDVEFPEKLEAPIAEITYDFSFAYIQEAFVGTLLDIAHRNDDDDDDDSDSKAGETGHGGGEDDKDLDRYELWRVMKKQVKMLRDEMEKDTRPPGKEKPPHEVPPIEMPSPPSAHRGEPTTAEFECPVGGPGLPDLSDPRAWSFERSIETLPLPQPGAFRDLCVMPPGALETTLHFQRFFKAATRRRESPDE